MESKFMRQLHGTSPTNHRHFLRHFRTIRNQKSCGGWCAAHLILHKSKGMDYRYPFPRKITRNASLLLTFVEHSHGNLKFKLKRQLWRRQNRAHRMIEFVRLLRWRKFPLESEDQVTKNEVHSSQIKCRGNNAQDFVELLSTLMG